MLLSVALEALRQLSQQAPANATLQVCVFSPGSIGPAPTCEITDISSGFDWDSGKILIDTQEPLTRLSPEDVADIRKSVSRGQSWHAFQRHKQMKAELKEKEVELRTAQATLESLRTEIAALHQCDDVTLDEALATLSSLAGPSAKAASSH